MSHPGADPVQDTCQQYATSLRKHATVTLASFRSKSEPKPTTATSLNADITSPYTWRQILDNRSLRGINLQPVHCQNNVALHLTCWIQTGPNRQMAEQGKPPYANKKTAGKLLQTYRSLQCKLISRVSNQAFIPVFIMVSPARFVICPTQRFRPIDPFVNRLIRGVSNQAFI